MDKHIRHPFTHSIRFTHNAFDVLNTTIASVVGEPAKGGRKLIVVIDHGVAAANPELQQQAIDCFRRCGFDCAPPLVIKGGEACKQGMETWMQILEAIRDARICRHSWVAAIGGGAVLDVVGFAAATAHRGVRLLRVPTTTLAQADSGIGVKNGINLFGRKNYLGSFAVPDAVVCDLELLETLTDDDWIGGFSEVLKVGILKSRELFRHVCELASSVRERDLHAAAPLLQESARLHLEHIADGGDPFELTRARPLDFGHWAAHRLETITGYACTHGHAVAIGIALDSTYANLQGRLHTDDLSAILDCISRLGLPTFHPALESDALFGGIEEFREHLGGELCITLVEGIGQPYEVSELDTRLIRKAIAELRHIRRPE